MGFQGRGEVSEELKPCPFCGGEAKVEIGLHNFDDAQVDCQQCGASGPLHDEAPFRDGARDYNRAEAIAAWNQRA